MVAGTQPGMRLGEPWAAAHGWAWDLGWGGRVLGLKGASTGGWEDGWEEKTESSSFIASGPFPGSGVFNLKV